MMDNLLAWAKAQMNGVQLNKRVFEFSEAAKAVTEQVRFQAENKGISIETQVANDLSVKADYDIVKLVLRNLIANAIKFSKENDTITVSAGRTEQYVEVQIIDEGMGIKAEDQPKLFGNEHFTTRGTKNEKGSGLGLNLSKEYIEEHGGELWFKSEHEVGTTFFFTLPLAEDYTEKEDMPDNHSDKEERETVDQTNG